MIAEAERHGKAMAMFWDDKIELSKAILEALRVAARPPQILPKPAQNIPKIFRPVEKVQPKAATQNYHVTPGSTANGSLPDGERLVLSAIAQYQEGVNRDQLSVLTGYKRSTRDAYVQRLGGKGYVSAQGRQISATQEGIDALGSHFEPLPMGPELQEYWRNRLPEGEKKVFEVLIQAHPDSVDREVISEQTGYKRSTRDAYIQRLQARRLCDSSRGSVKASKDLFE